MRFTDGLWESRNGYKLHRAHSLWEWRAEKDQVHFMVPCTEIRSLRDTIVGPVLHFTITAPKADILAVKVYHFTGKRSAGHTLTWMFPIGRWKYARRSRRSL
ncbi:hypothetical protein LC724_10990 [Blautia sp. RD014234]|nr:hypothetical protein [Blautia parvula]